MFRNSRLFVVLLLFLFSCGPEKKNHPSEDINGNKTGDPENTVANDFVQDTLMIDDQSFPFPSDSVPMIMEKAGMCMCDTVKAKENQFAPCHPNFFRYFKNTRGHFKEGFLVEVRPFVLGRYYRVVNIVRAEDGSYKISNDLRGQLLELRTTPNGRYDMVMRYIDKSVGTIAVLHKWKKYHYEPVEVIEINDWIVKDDKKDSLNNVYLKDFPWGF